MKHLTALFIFLIAFFQINADGIEFSKENWKELLVKAKSSNKIIFVDFYATWCGPCRGLEKEVFTNDEIGKYFNENFITKRVNAETEDLDLVKQMNIEAYPTLVFFDPNGKALYKVVGAPDMEQLMNYAKKVSALPALIKDNAWKATPENLASYLEAIGTHEPATAQKIAAEYLASLNQEDLLKEENWLILSTYVKDATDASWQYALQKKDYFGETFGSFYGCVGKLAEEMLNKASEARNPALLFIKTDLDLLYMNSQGDSSETREQLQLWNTVAYAEKTKDMPGYAAKLQVYLKKYSWESGNVLTYYAMKIFTSDHSSAVNNSAISWAERALKLDPKNYTVHFALAMGYSKSNNTVKSNQALQNFLRLSKSDPNLLDKINMLLSY